MKRTLSIFGLLAVLGLGLAGGAGAQANYTPPPASKPADVGLKSMFSVSNYGAKGDGTTDDTAAIQAALTAAGAAGGGVVQCHSGVYKLTGLLNIPVNVTLKGTYEGALTHNGYRDGTPFPTLASGGTGFLMPPATGSGNGTADITLNTNSTLEGVALYDPTQSQTVAPPTADKYWIAMHGKNPTVRNVEGVNPYQFIDIESTSAALSGQTERATVQDVVGQPLYVGISVGAAGLGGISDIPRFTNVHFNPYWSFPQAGTSIPAAVSNWVAANGTAFNLGDVDEIIFSECFCYGYHNGVLMSKPSRGAYGSWTGGGMDACVYDVYNAGSQSYGFRFANAGLIAVGTNAIQINAQSGSGPLMFANCSFWGVSGNAYIAQNAGNDLIAFSNCSFCNWGGGGSSYTALNVQSGRMQVTGCDFRQATGGQVNTASGASAILTGNYIKSGKNFGTGTGTNTDTGNVVY